MLHFKEMVVLYGVFGQFILISHLVFFFFDKKQQDKDDVPHKKTLLFLKIVAVL